MSIPENTYTEDELIAVFSKLFPQGFAGADIRRAIAPGGWESSPLVALFHPSAEQRYEEAVRIHANMAGLLRKDKSPSPAPTREEFVDDSDDALAPDEEISRLVGMCLWDIFSESHDVLDDAGRELSLGSFRASAGFLADRLNEQVKAGFVRGPAIDAQTRAAEVQKQMRELMPGMGSDLMFEFMKEHQTGPYDYMDFYMGTSSIAGRADLSPVYRMIFTRLKALDLDWKYSFPRLHLVDMRPLKEELDARESEESGEPDWLNYSPETELAKDEENREKDRELAEMRESLDDGYRESVEAALKLPPPTTVRAYADVFGDFPSGWPPNANDPT